MSLYQVYFYEDPTSIIDAPRYGGMIIWKKYLELEKKRLNKNGKSAIIKKHKIQNKTTLFTEDESITKKEYEEMRERIKEEKVKKYDNNRMKKDTNND